MAEHVVLGARISSGLLAGLYFAFAVVVMPALRGSDDATFVGTMKRINVSIVNPVFVVVFFAAPLLAVMAAGLVHSPMAYTAAALGVITLLITVAINVPLNNKLAAGASRPDFESAWVLWNVIRTLTGIGSLICLLLLPSTAH